MMRSRGCAKTLEFFRALSSPRDNFQMQNMKRNQISKGKLYCPFFPFQSAGEEQKAVEKPLPGLEDIEGV